MGLGPSSIESRATHSVPNHDARAFPGGYGFFERNPVPRTQHARERSWVNVGLFSNTVKRRCLLRCMSPPLLFFYCAWFRGRTEGRRQDSRRGQPEGMESACEEDTLTRE